MLNLSPISSHSERKWRMVIIGMCLLLVLFYMTSPAWAERQKLSRTDNMIQMFWDMWEDIWGYKVNAGSRKTPCLSIPVLENNPYLRVGKEEVFLMWEGGKPPYTVNVRRIKGKRIKPIQTHDKMIRLSKPELEKLNLSQGSQVKVYIKSKGTKEKTSGKFTLVSNLPLPPSPKANRPECTKWLAAQGQEWKLEAFQVLAEGGDKKLLSKCGL